MSLSRLAFRSLRARPLRAALSTLGVALGVAVLFAGLATNAGVEASVQGTVRDLVGRADLRVAAFGESGLSADTVARIAGTPGIAVAAPALERRTYLGTGLALGEQLPPPVTVLGIDPTLDPRLHDLSLVGGSALVDPNEHSALITERLAAQDGLTVGAPLTMQGVGDRTTFRVVGIIRGDGPLTGAFGRTVVVPLATAQAVFDDPGVTRVDIGLAGGTDAATVSAALETRLTARALRPVVTAGPRRGAARLHDRLPGHDRTHRRDRPVRRGLPDLQHVVDDGRRADPRGRTPSSGWRQSRSGHVVHAHPGPRAGRGRFAVRAPGRWTARGRDGRLRPDGRVGHPGRDRRCRSMPRSSRSWSVSA